VIYHENGGSNRSAKVSNYMESFEIYSYSETDEDSSLVECNAASITNRNGLMPHKTLISSIRHHTPGDGDPEKLSPNLFISSR
jgi:ribosomal protein S12 methylthiotransferase accessory factor YcaO